MRQNVLVNNSEKYGGQYVATRSFDDRDVISCGADPADVIDEAIRKGAAHPVIVYVPVHGMVSVY